MEASKFQIENEHQDVILLSEEEKAIQKKILLEAEAFSKDPEMAICSKVGIGSCWEF